MQKHRQDDNIIKLAVAFFFGPTYLINKFNRLHEGKIYIDYLCHYNMLAGL
jgi:hypothetical protein